MKKTAAFLLIIMILSVIAGLALAAPAYEEDVQPHAVMLLDAVTGKVLYEKNADERIRPASTTKILTCIVALENSELDEIVDIGPEGDWTGSGYSLLGTKNGEQIVMGDLLTGLMLVSGNDAAAAVAVHVGGSEEAFVRLMNKKARDIGMLDSHFENPHGTDKDGHYVTARDMSLLVRYAMQNETFMDIVGKATYDMPKTNKNSEHTVKNTNHLLRMDEEAVEGAYYEYATGIKTGSTPKAMRCLVSSAEKDGMQLACLIFGDETKEGTYRWPTAKDLFEYGFDNYKTVDVYAAVERGEQPVMKVQNTSSEDDVLELNVRITGEQMVTMNRQIAQGIVEEGGVTSAVELYSGQQLNAPVNAGDVVGHITYRIAETSEVLCQGELTASRDVDVQGEIAIDVTQETPRPDQDAQPIESDVPSSGDTTLVSGIGWLWVALGVVLLGIIVFLVISLIRGSRR